MAIKMFKMILNAVIDTYKTSWIDSDRTEIFNCLQACRKVLFIYLEIGEIFHIQAVNFKSSLICLYPLLYNALEIADPAYLGGYAECKSNFISQITGDPQLMIRPTTMVIGE